MSLSARLIGGWLGVRSLAGQALVQGYWAKYSVVPRVFHDVGV